MHKASSLRQALLAGNKRKKDVAHDILNGIKDKKKFWMIGFGLSGLLLLAGGYCLYRTWWDGIGMWGENKSINWAWDITNFVWWIGIGHAGTLISAILLLCRAKWRTSINRSAEAMTHCAVSCSSFYILAHLGRPWLFYWVFPIPNTYGDLWVNFNSPLVWDAFAILTYLLVSMLYWYLGLIPDLAQLREMSSGFKKRMYKILSLNWENSTWQWRRYESIMLTIAGLATALVISVHSIVAMDFATSILKGWHSTFFPPYFVIGAILSGFAMVLTLLIPLRKLLNLEDYITVRHIENMNKLVILTSGLIGISYFIEIFKAWYIGKLDGFMMFYRMGGDYATFFYLMLLFNALLPQLLWFKSLRRNLMFSFCLSLLVNIGMWLERFVIIVTTLSRGYLPSSWALFFPSMYDVGVFIFSIGLFFFLFLLFIRYVPVVTMWEVKEMIETPVNNTSREQSKAQEKGVESH
ncbi:Ni/Fe-hydrogenase subunit HybB-like protein [Catalinimonas alkaloidigena]|uniref:NrfD/PsrC family molybdoenzyme membrane anchor subunit n=1 Tax=Catalinimonas alkaloidigena TaxID=1075417 RepID=UPI0024060CF6|nr:NrfD/PsrC family molybdoenzyme membrane anchor subunit [Catalinimonas alkaloidigena]MDF9797091.1 Ni/Fe-hydrogenase subunit HybB-like protein [Catalinimonas alkaloidigena]